jgi:hypothetical protein
LRTIAGTDPARLPFSPYGTRLLDEAVRLALVGSPTRATKVDARDRGIERCRDLRRPGRNVERTMNRLEIAGLTLRSAASPCGDHRPTMREFP